MRLAGSPSRGGTVGAGAGLVTGVGWVTGLGRDTGLGFIARGLGAKHEEHGMRCCE